MERIISLASGNIWTWDKLLKNKADQLFYFRKLKIDGMEITFSSKEDLYNFKLSSSDEKWLKSLKYVSIHAPFGLTRDADDEAEVVKQLKFIAKLYKEIKAKNVVIHPQELPRSEILNKFNFKVSIENLKPKKKFTIPKLREILKKYPKMGFCLDVTHSYYWSKDETAELIKAFGKRITQIHFSGNYRKQEHTSLRKVSRDFLFSIEPVFEIDVPIVIEENIKVKSENFLREEVEFIKNMFAE